MRAVLIALGAVALVAAAPASAGKAPSKKVLVQDNFFLPAKVTINPGTIVRWTWPDDTGDVHDVKLTKAPSGVRKFQSDPGASGIVYSRKLTKPGEYRILCTFHEEEMKMTVRVRKPR